MKTPSEFELNQLMHVVYDPVKAHEYYVRTRKLKGRQRGHSDDPRTGKTREQIHKDARAKQRQELSQQISNLEDKLKQLETRIREREHAAASEDRKSKTAAEKAKAARENKQYREKHHQKLKSERASSSKSGGGSSTKKSSSSKHSISDLKALAIRVRGQIQIAKQKLAAL
jgi:chromosome segregation ATPase